MVFQELKMGYYGDLGGRGPGNIALEPKLTDPGRPERSIGAILDGNH